jgi:hypothetical protein
MKILGWVILAGGLGGCAVVAQNDARREYQASLVEYRTCLRTHDDPAACENLHKIVQTNERALNTIAGRRYSVSTTTD